MGEESLYELAKRYKKFGKVTELTRNNYVRVLGAKKEWKNALFGQNWHDDESPKKKYMKKIRRVGNEIEFGDMRGELFPLDYLDQFDDPKKHFKKNRPLVTGGGADPIFIVEYKPAVNVKKTAAAKKKQVAKKPIAKKYTSRKSPPFPANDYCNKRKKGNDGKMYESRRTTAGYCRWFKV